MAMREYNRISGRFWTGRTGKAIRQLGRDHQVVALYLLTCPSTTWIGIYYLPIPTMCHEIGMDAETAGRVLADLTAIDFAHYDEDTEYVWVPNAALYQLGRSLEGEKNNLRTGVENDLSALNGHRFVGEFVAKYSAVYRLRSPFEGTSEGCPVPEKPPSKGSGDAPGPLRYTAPRQRQHRDSTSTSTSTSTETAPATEGPRAAKGRRNPPTGSRFVPEDFTLTDDLRAYAMGQGLEAAAVDAEVAKFTQHEFSRPIHDWNRAWRRWALNAVQFRQERNGAPNRTARGPYQHAADRTMEAIDEAFGRKP